jgi:type IV secretion system protein VirD4
MSPTFRAFFGCVVAVPLMLVLGLPGWIYAVHGFGLWPDEVAGFIDSWWTIWQRFDAVTIAQTFWGVLNGRTAPFSQNGPVVLMVLSTLVGVVAAACGLTAPSVNPRVLGGNQLGGARWATDKELAACKRGIEIGLSTRTREPVRLLLESNILSFAPPRAGKTSGLLLPNLVGAGPGAWFGPAVVIDPKGEVYRMVAERRRQLGRKVVCLDPFGIAGGNDRWNPFSGMKPNQALAVSRMIGAMLVEIGENNQYFRQRSTMALRGTIIALLARGETTPADVRDVFINYEALVDLTTGSDDPNVKACREFLAKEPRVYEQITSTAETAFEWLQDEALVDASSSSTFTMEEVARGHADLFIILPTGNNDVLAPWLRLVFGELFAAARRRRQPGDQRVVVFVDEAAVLQRFGQLSEALGELPGYGISLWTFWQTRGQIEERYGKPGLGTFFGTAQITTLSDLTPTLVQEAADWSAAVGSRTEAVSTVNQTGKDNARGSSQTPHRVPLMHPEDVTTMDEDELLAFVRVSGKQRPAILKKIRPHREKRFEGTYVNTHSSPTAG